MPASPLSIKRLLLNALTYAGVAAPFAPFMRDRASILLLHRFCNPDLGIAGHDPAELQQVLEHLRRRKYELVSLLDLFRRLGGEGPPLRSAVAFTIDDGYVDQATVAASLFAAFDCPVTTFVITGFLDRQFWPWWDKIAYIFRHTARDRIQLRFGSKKLDYQWSKNSERADVAANLVTLCKKLPHAEKEGAIQLLANKAEVDLPLQIPDTYAPMSWAQLRSCEEQGMSFGAHTVTHPVLSQVSDEQSEHEIKHSWERLCAEARKPVPIFAFPFGYQADFGPREVGFLKSQGFLGAVSAVPDCSTATIFREGDARYRVPRFGYPDSLPHVVQYVSGVERFKDIVRAT